MFRAPLQADSKYADQYRAAGSDFWGSTVLRKDQSLVLDAVKRHRPNGTVLDIGCYDGGLLRQLGSSYEVHGIEPSQAAAAEAARHGVKIVGSSVECLRDIDMHFDIITAVDVIEHLTSPLEFIRMAEQHLTPEGVLVLSTGDSAALPWLIAGGRYWYCAIPEHLSFISRKWVHHMISGTSWKLSDCLRFRHADASQGGLFLLEHSLRLAAQSVAALAETTIALPLSATANTRGPRFHLGVAGLFRDHLLVVLQRGDV